MAIWPEPSGLMREFDESTQMRLDEEVAENLYRKMGFMQQMRHLFTKWLGAP